MEVTPVVTAAGDLKFHVALELIEDSLMPRLIRFDLRIDWGFDGVV